LIIEIVVAYIFVNDARSNKVFMVIFYFYNNISPVSLYFFEYPYAFFFIIFPSLIIINHNPGNPY